jgi:hypothetical protein
MPNTLNPDVNSFDVDTDGESQSNIQSIPTNESDPDTEIPVPPDRQRDSVPIEEPPDVRDKPPIDEDRGDDIERIV